MEAPLVVKVMVFSLLAPHPFIDDPLMCISFSYLTGWCEMLGSRTIISFAGGWILSGCITYSSVRSPIVLSSWWTLVLFAKSICPAIVARRPLYRHSNIMIMTITTIINPSRYGARVCARYLVGVSICIIAGAWYLLRKSGSCCLLPSRKCIFALACDTRHYKQPRIVFSSFVARSTLGRLSQDVNVSRPCNMW